MIKIKIYTLSDCEICKKYKRLLTDHGLHFEEYICTESDQHCDAVEDLCRCEMYPITKLTISTNTSVYLAITTDIRKRNTNLVKDSNTYIYYLDSINNVINVIKNI